MIYGEDSNYFKNKSVKTRNKAVTKKADFSGLDVFFSLGEYSKKEKYNIKKKPILNDFSKRKMKTRFMNNFNIVHRKTAGGHSINRHGDIQEPNVNCIIQRYMRSAMCIKRNDMRLNVSTSMRDMQFRLRSMMRSNKSVGGNRESERSGSNKNKVWYNDNGRFAEESNSMEDVMIHFNDNIDDFEGNLDLSYSELYVWLTDLPWLEEQDYIIDMELFNDLIFNINHTPISSKFIVEEFILISFDFV